MCAFKLLNRRRRKKKCEGERARGGSSIIVVVIIIICPGVWQQEGPHISLPSPRNGTTHGGVPSEGRKLRHLLAVSGRGERGGGRETLLLHNTAPSHTSLFNAPCPEKGRREKKKRSTKQARARSPRHGGTHHSSSGGGSDGSVSLGMCACHTRPSEEWRRSRERGRREGAAGWWWRGQRDLWSSSSSGIPTLGCTPSSSAAEWCPSRRQTQTGCSLCLLHM